MPDINVAGLDLSLTNSGIVAVATGLDKRWMHPYHWQRVGFGSENNDAADYDERSRRIVSTTVAILAAVDELNQRAPLDLIVIEGPIYHTPPYGLRGYFDRSGLWHGVYAGLRRRKHKLAVIAPKRRAMFITGNGNADKKVVLICCRTWWDGEQAHQIQDDNLADAAGMAVMGGMSLGGKSPFRMKAYHAQNVIEQRWPHGKARLA